MENAPKNKKIINIFLMFISKRENNNKIISHKSFLFLQTICIFVNKNLSEKSVLC